MKTLERSQYRHNCCATADESCCRLAADHGGHRAGQRAPLASDQRGHGGGDPARILHRRRFGVRSAHEGTHAALVIRRGSFLAPQRQERPRHLTAGGVWPESGCPHNAHVFTVVCQLPHLLPYLRDTDFFSEQPAENVLCMFRSCSCLSLYTFLNGDITDK